ncbi:hypothetical protein PUN28_006791 [Cardiocondyla obscurior]|uniref:Uncharacterized protein n=1 Tax=Cardiocondyla obscurior TaxID=286306 RepID=A0AAW2G5T2_9HYME
MHAVTEFQARVIIVAERDRLDGYHARALAYDKQRREKKEKKIKNKKTLLHVDERIKNCRAVGSEETR